MGHEASKTKKLCSDEFTKYLSGRGIDIGCGKDPITTETTPFDQEHGDANVIANYFPANHFDFVFSSHCLEHMLNPKAALNEWFKILKPGGYMVFLVPDEDLYEQGLLPSAFNSDHKHTFTLNKKKSWSPKSINILEMVKEFPARTILAQLQDHNFDYSLKKHRPNKVQLKLGRIGMKFYRAFKRVQFSNFNLGLFFVKVFSAIGGAFDQSSFADDRLCQIMVVLQKN